MESMADYMDQIEKSMERVGLGDIVNTKVIEVKYDEVMVDLGSGMDGVITKENYTDLDLDLREIVQVGDEIQALVTRIDKNTGDVSLSKKRADSETAFEKLAEALDKDLSVKVMMQTEVKGGMTALFNGVRIFIPFSQLGLEVGETATNLAKTLQSIKITQVDEDDNRVIGSLKAFRREERDRLGANEMKEMKIGDRLKGTVQSLQKYGAFVRVGNVEGLIHISDLSWKRILHANEVLEVGQDVNVLVSDINHENGKLSLKLDNIEPKAVKADTEGEDSQPSQLEVGGIYQGKVTDFASFGAFVTIGDSVTGLVHISNIAEERITKPSERLKIGQDVKVMVISIDNDTKKVGLSIKDALDAEVDDYEDYLEEDEAVTLGDIFAEKLKSLKF